MKKWLVILLLTATTFCHAVAIRGTGIQLFNATTATIALPAGTVLNDLAYLYIGGGCGGVVPAGWVSIPNVESVQTLPRYGGGTYNIVAVAKVLDSTDISNGNITVTAGCSFNSVAIIVTLVGNSSGIREWDGSQGTSSPATITTSANPQNGDLALYFSGNRSAGAAPTVSRGTLLQSAADGSAACGSLYSEVMTGGSVAPVFTFPTTANQTSFVLILSSGSAPAVGLAQ